MTATLSRRQAMLAGASAFAAATTSFRAFAQDNAALQAALDWFNAIGQLDNGKPYTLETLAKVQYLSFDDDAQKKAADDDYRHLAALPELGGVDLGLYNAVTPGDAACPHLAKIAGLWNLTLTFCPVGDEGMKAFEGHARLKSLGLDSTKVTGAAGASFAKMPALEDLNLTSTAFDDAGLAALSTSPTLRALNIGGAKGVTDAGLASIGALPAIERVSLNNCKIDEGLKAFGGSKTIRELGFMSAGVTDKGAAGLAGMTAIKSLYAWNNPGITDEGLKTIGGLITLETIYANELSLTDGGLAALKDLQKLRWLWLDGCTALTDAMVPHLLALKAMESLKLNETKLTDAGLLALADLPELDSVDARKTGVTKAGVDAFLAKKPKARVSI